MQIKMIERRIEKQEEAKKSRVIKHGVWKKLSRYGPRYREMCAVVRLLKRV